MFRQHFQSTDSFQFNCKKFPYITVYIYIYDEIWYISKFLRKWKSLHVPKFQRTIETTPCQSFQRKGKLPDETETKKRKGGSWMNDCDDTAHITCAQSCHLYRSSYEWPNSLFERNFVLANDEFLREDWISRNSSRRRINSTNSTQQRKSSMWRGILEKRREEESSVRYFDQLSVGQKFYTWFLREDVRTKGKRRLSRRRRGDERARRKTKRRARQAWRAEYGNSQLIRGRLPCLKYRQFLRF